MGSKNKKSAGMQNNAPFNQKQGGAYLKK